MEQDASVADDPLDDRGRPAWASFQRASTRAWSLSVGSSTAMISRAATRSKRRGLQLQQLFQR